MNKAFFSIIAYLTVILWGATGVLVIGSIVHSVVGLPINIIVGLVFMVIAWFLYLKQRNTLQIIALLTAENHQQLAKRLLRLESILFILSGVFAAILFSGAFFRVFTEKMAVFG